MTVQDGWRWCNKCQGLFFGASSQGVCPAGGGHGGNKSGNYVLINNTPQAVGQPDWLWCSQCQGLFYGGSGVQAGACPGASGEFGSHDGSKSGKYTLFNNDPDAFGQPDWLWCNKCQGLFYYGGGSSVGVGVCPGGGGGHDGSKSGQYKLMHYRDY